MDMSLLERRTISGRVELREGADKVASVRGYGAVFNSNSLDLGGFIERIAPGAFARSLKEGADVRLLVDHDSAKVLGRRSAGTLEVSEDDTGLLVCSPMPDTSYARDLAVSMKRGDISQMSFGFIPRKDRWDKSPDGLLRTLLDVDVIECSVVTFPAYPTTSAAVRSVVEEALHGRAKMFHFERVQRSAELL